MDNKNNLIKAINIQKTDIDKEQISKMIVEEKTIHKEVFEQYKNVKENNGYTYNNNANKSLPVMYWFQNSHEGRVLFLVLYTEKCKWNRCVGCNLPSQSSLNNIPFDMIKKQIDYIFDYIINYDINIDKNTIDKIILSVNGSVFDEKTFPNSSLMYFLLKTNEHLPSLKKLTLETRPEFVELSELEIIRNILNETGHTKIEVAIGFEIFDEFKRNKLFKKGLTNKHFIHFVEKLSLNNFELKVYFMLKPLIDMTEEEAINDIYEALDFLQSLENKYSINISMHLNPTYGALGTPLETAFIEKKWTPPLFQSIKKIIKKAYDTNIDLYVGLYDEGLAIEGSNWTNNTSKEDIERVKIWNKTQNYIDFNKKTYK